MGRHILPIKSDQFDYFEHNKIAWSTPFLQQAWFALVFWSKKENAINNPPLKKNKPLTHHVWFIKLPLDEQTKLNLATRDEFLHHLLAILTTYQHNNHHEILHYLENSMHDNPYGFTPKEEQMANFHAIVHQHLSLPSSSYYLNCQNFFIKLNNKKLESIKHWQTLELQGMADMTARLDEKIQSSTAELKTNHQLINDNLTRLPIEVFLILSSCLEHHQISTQLTTTIYNYVIKQFAQTEKKNSIELIPLCIASIRATSQSKNSLLQQQLLTHILQTITPNIEILATISGRCWSSLKQADLLMHFLEALVICQYQYPNAFNAILSDLMFIPTMREPILIAFRANNRSKQLTYAIGHFFNQI
jgi:flagellin-specific chaperone FliS